MFVGHTILTARSKLAVQALAALRQWIEAELRRRRTLCELERLDEAGLNDVGLKRCELPHATLYVRCCCVRAEQRRRAGRVK